MVNIENFLKYNIFFTYQREDVSHYGRCFTITGIYKSNTIYNIESLGITNSNDLANKIEPFIYYLASKYLKRRENNYNYLVSLDLGLFFVDESSDNENKYIRVNRFYMDIHARQNYHLWLYLERKEINNINENLLTKPFEIHIDVGCEYSPEDPETEEEEDEQPSTVIKSFREDKSVVCLSKEPKVLFYDCMHYCVCLECEEIKPFSSCPYRRTRILTKII